ncbi:endonuclease exonuclease phosphatase family protein [Stemphylium lycopersici]|uniref:Endonuclease exonuclease phosphatase family protein n=1 Tax=Stemphylium lycopersici TaxID=183478 RepID=A0A364N7Q4_STELY|nr:endonuclease exonuclease phosphatase family protein [Stemphylium lycopersici]RAR13310.1 endonuclease exonuclease phosphatase family protein [Stemphylium lycopersici]
MASAKPTPAMEAIAATLPSAIEKCEDAFYNPRHQDYYHISSKGIWQPASAHQTPTSDNSLPALHARRIRLISWNIDVLIPFARERMSAALNHLNELVLSTPQDVAIIIFLQEMGVSDMVQIRESAWVKQRFNLTEVDENNWLSPHYGTTTLVDRRLQINSVFRVPWYSKFNRDGLFVDVSLSSSIEPGPEKRVMRVCNVHLESLVADPPVRPIQLATARQYLAQSNVSSGIVAGDFNAIQPFDRTLHTENNLTDAYLHCNKTGDEEDGYTWGHQVSQALRNRFGCSRMDKAMYMGSIRAERFERIGVDVKVAEEHGEKMRKEGHLEWVTDHYGVMADFELSSDEELNQVKPSSTR